MEQTITPAHTGSVWLTIAGVGLKGSEPGDFAQRMTRATSLAVDARTCGAGRSH